MRKINNRLPIWLIALIVFPGVHVLAQSRFSNGFRLYHFTSPYTCFPDEMRLNGYNYDSTFFNYADHYSDSSALLVVPEKFTGEHPSVNILFWFHGWHNNVDTALSYYHLATQFAASGKNAVLVLAEAARNAPDSYGGKLEKPGDFSKLLDQVMDELRKNGLVPATCQPGNILLAGHSGAYRVIAYMLQNGGVAVQEVDLFDALYGQTDKFSDWLRKDPARKLINFYTDSGGGTREVSEQMMGDLKKQGLQVVFTEESNLTAALLRSSRVIFIHSSREHNNIIFNPDNFRLFLENSPFLKTGP